MEKNYVRGIVKGLRKTIAILALGLVAQQANAQVISFSASFTNGATPSVTVANDWHTFRANVAALPYYELKMYNNLGGSISCLNPSVVQSIATAFRTGTSGTFIDGANTWNIGVCGAAGSPSQTCYELSVNSSNCQCVTGYVARPAIGNSNWGGVNTATCTGPTQTITVEFWYGSPCPLPPTKTASNFTSTSATLSWTAPSTTIGYEWYVDQLGAYPPMTQVGTATTATSVNVSNLTPSTKYYLHLRNKCSSTSISIWDTMSFTTLPPCKPPVNFQPKNLTPSSGTVTWGKWPSALTYDYIVDQSRTAPTSITGVKNQVDTFDNLNSLTENTWYYIHLRSKCAANEISDWGLDSFLTPIPCRAPDVKISNVNTNAAVAYWDEVPTATKYEYVINTSATPPVMGTEYNFTSLNLSALNDGKDYYVHVRSHCVSLGINGISPWGSAAFKTFPVGINTVSANNFSITTYPNPVKDVVTVKLNGVSTNANITVTDVNGRIVRNATATAGTDVEINMGGLTPGFYMLKYMDDKNFGQIKITKE